jgi:hypothetical protein
VTVASEAAAWRSTSTSRLRESKTAAKRDTFAAAAQLETACRSCPFVAAGVRA